MQSSSVPLPYRFPEVKEDALYLAVIALMITIIYLFITIASPVLNPTNG